MQVGPEFRAKVEQRIRQLEGRAASGISGQAKVLARAEKYDHKARVTSLMTPMMLSSVHVCLIDHG